MTTPTPQPPPPRYWTAGASAYTRSDGGGPITLGRATIQEVAPNLWHIRVDDAYADWALTGWGARWKAWRLTRPTAQ